jgi:hypothetical protein
VSHDRNRMADLHRIHADVGIPRRQGQ